MEIVKMLVLSTAHISAETNETLLGATDILAGGGNPQTNLPSFYAKGDYGWVVYSRTYISDSDPIGPADLAEVMAFARGQGCDWIMLDQDGDTIADLPTFDW